MGREHELLDAARSGNIAQVAKILDYISKKNIGPLSSFRRSPNINHQDGNGYTPLHHACLNNHLEIVRLLLENGCKPDIKDVRGLTPLYLASWAGHCEIVKILLNNPRTNLDVNVYTSENETPLHCAAQYGHIGVLGTLLAYGANPNIRNNCFQTALDLAAQYGRLQIVQKLICTHPELLDTYRERHDSLNDLSKSVYLNVQAASSNKHIFTHSCLHLASQNGHERVVEVLLDAGVDVNIMTHAGTALHVAALSFKQAIVRILLQAGVNVDAVDGNGKTVLELLKNYPPHVTYGIVSMIKAVNDNNNNNDCNFRHTRSTSNSTILTEEGEGDDDDTDYERREKAHTMPNFVYRSPTSNASYQKNYQKNNYSSSAAVRPSDKTFEANGHSPAIMSLDRAMKNSAGLYLKMKPVLTSESDNSDDNKPQKSIKPDLVSNIHLTYSPNLTRSKKAYEKVYMASTGYRKSKTTHPLAVSTTNSTDEYVKMSVPDAKRLVQSHSFHHSGNSGKEFVKPKPPMPSPRIIDVQCHPDFTDYANVVPNTTSNNSNNSRGETRITKITDANNNNNNNTHSPTPEFPPPTVTEAEHTILEYIQPNANGTSKSKRSSLRLSEGDELNLNAYLAKTSLLESRQSNMSDNVEEFVGDNPFAGLFKGSTLNLDSDDKETARHSMRLRSPSLVRSIEPIPAKKQIEKKTDDFDELQVWEEINTILESMGNEFKPEPTTSIAKDIEKTTDETSEVNKNFYIRKPSDIQLRTSKSGAAPNWCHAPNTLIFGQILYKVFYLGSTVVKELHGTLSTRKSIQKLKRNQCLSSEEELNANLINDCNKLTRILKENNQQKRLEVEISISCSGVRFIDVENKGTISIHDIENINCVCQDVEHMQYFAYITMEKGIHYCHVFMVDNWELAKEIILTLGQAFEVAYQLVLNNVGIKEKLKTNFE